MTTTVTSSTTNKYINVGTAYNSQTQSGQKNGVQVTPTITFNGTESQSNSVTVTGNKVTTTSYLTNLALQYSNGAFILYYFPDGTCSQGTVFGTQQGNISYTSGQTSCVFTITIPAGFTIPIVINGETYELLFSTPANFNYTLFLYQLGTTTNIAASQEDVSRGRFSWFAQNQNNSSSFTFTGVITTTTGTPYTISGTTFIVPLLLDSTSRVTIVNEGGNSGSDPSCIANYFDPFSTNISSTNYVQYSYIGPSGLCIQINSTVTYTQVTS